MKAIIAGLGQVGAKYDRDLSTSYSHRNSLLRNSSFQNIWLYDRNIAAYEKLIPQSKEVFTTDPSVLPEFVDLLILSVPTKHHLNTLDKLLAQIHVNKILLEKPVGSSLREFNQIRAILEQKSDSVFVNYMRNFHPSIKEVKEWIKSIHGQLISIRCNADRNHLNSSSHLIALASCILGEPFSFHSQPTKSNGSIKVTTNHGLLCLDSSYDSLQYPIFTLELFFETAYITYSSLDNGWTYFIIDKSPKKNIHAKTLAKSASVPFELELIQDIVLQTVLSKATPSSLMVDLNASEFIHRLINETWT